MQMKKKITIKVKTQELPVEDQNGAVESVVAHNEGVTWRSRIRIRIRIRDKSDADPHQGDAEPVQT
jgi:hypothetical protein